MVKLINETLLSAGSMVKLLLGKGPRSLLLVLILFVGLILFGLKGANQVTHVPEIHNYLERLAESRFYLLLDLIGTAAFGISGFLRAVKRRYDLWGALVLTMLPAVGGGVIRDLLIGGDRLPLFVFREPLYLVVILMVVLVGTIVANTLSPGQLRSPAWGGLLCICDSIGLASFTVIGTRVAMLAHLDWWFLPLSAALTCAGGGVLMDVVSGREPRTFLGEPYEELAILGSLVLILLWTIAARFAPLTWPSKAAMEFSWMLVFVSRLLVVRFGWRSWRLPPSGN